jgi:DNA-binding MarR family transcriptional regulator
MEVSPASRAARFMCAFFRLKRTMHARVNPRIKAEHGLELSDLLLLRQIASSDMSPTELAEHLRIPASAVSRGLDSLEGAGLVVRSLDKQDARRRAVSLTEGGKELLRSAHATLESEVDAILSVLSDAELERFFETFEAITAMHQENE